MGNRIPLSPCASSAARAAGETATSWAIVRELLLMHPEYTHGRMEPLIAGIDNKFRGKARPTTAWFDALATLFPNEPQLHGRLVVVGLYEIDDALKQVVPEDAIKTIRDDMARYDAH